MKTNKINTTRPSYQKRNWSAYNQALVARGSLSLWLSQEAIASWRAPRSVNCKKNGHPFWYSNTCIVALGCIREVTGLGLRQTIGLAQERFRATGLELAVPDYTQLCRRLRHAKLPVSSRTRLPSGNLVLLVDSTGVKVSGEGNWKIRMHGKAHATKWRKLHVLTDYASGKIVAHHLEDAPRPDWSQTARLLRALPAHFHCQLKGSTLIGDGAYDVKPVRRLMATYGGHALAPPGKAAILHPRDPILTLRNEAIRFIAAHGTTNWKVASGYSRRSRIEATMWRYKSAFGDRLSARTDEAQSSQVSFRSFILNQWLEQGMPAGSGHS